MPVATPIPLAPPPPPPSPRSPTPRRALSACPAGLPDQGVVGPAERGQRAVEGRPGHAGLPAALHRPGLLQVGRWAGLRAGGGVGGAREPGAWSRGGGLWVAPRGGRGRGGAGPRGGWAGPQMGGAARRVGVAEGSRGGAVGGACGGRGRRLGTGREVEGQAGLTTAPALPASPPTCAPCPRLPRTGSRLARPPARAAGTASCAGCLACAPSSRRPWWCST